MELLYSCILLHRFENTNKAKGGQLKARHLDGSKQTVEKILFWLLQTI